LIVLSQRLATVLHPDQTETAVRALNAYFTPRPFGRYSGAHFERLGGGGDRPAVADQFIAEDLVAVATLAVNITGDAAIEILETRATQLRQLLQLIPTDRPLADMTTEEIGAAWPVRVLYRELVSINSIGETSATKLIARKRPHLVPIFDSVITDELRIVNGHYWAPMHAWLTANGRANHRRLETLRSSAGLWPELSALRVFDVSLG
jgi:hypothetical protein